MNRAILRAEALGWYVRAVPDHERTKNRQTNRNRYLVFFEAAAKIYKNPELNTGPGDPGLSIEIEDKDRTIQVVIKCDLRMDMIRDYRRPKYAYESGKIQYGKMETNTDFFYTNRT